jgi:hypothetical protein
MGPRHDGAGSKSRGWGSLPRLAQADGGARTVELRWTEVVAGVPRREGTQGAEVRKGGERWAWCGEAETGAHFIGVERQWWGVETVGQVAAGGVLPRHRLLEGETTGQRRFMGKLKRSR